jgi:hypothetical protein
MINTAIGDEKVIRTILNTMRDLEDNPASSPSALRGVALNSSR